MARYQRLFVALLTAGLLAACDENKPADTPSTAATMAGSARTAAAPKPVATGEPSAVPTMPAAPPAPPTPMYAPAAFNVDPTHSAVAFSVRHFAMAWVRGTFDKFTGTVFLDEGTPSNSKIDVSIDIDSVDTREPKRDGHLKSPDFFDAKKYPTMTFKSTNVERVASGYRVTGDLTLHGTTKSVILDVDPISPELASPLKTVVRGTHASTKLSRKDFGLVWNIALETGGVAVSDEVAVDLDLELVKKTAAAK
jgi:polyisoprenoid-binding protein YceI